jgi:hypothetical protein
MSLAGEGLEGPLSNFTKPKLRPHLKNELVKNPPPLSLSPHPSLSPLPLTLLLKVKRSDTVKFMTLESIYILIYILYIAAKIFPLSIISESYSNLATFIPPGRMDLANYPAGEGFEAAQ